ncbi:hypothetical protein CIP100275_02248 [Corynebacterium diphtheriae]|uniref:hypothetical protein n=1 Tax=Corynebacterium diphtheriae TaxID=1717 RepID=UPI00024693E6|nr:hypothetical protein [Corynebacterium diphtheriae]AEX84328.1 hypothetical protein CDVA01_2064 [Corynebacterium diphtheriae VA01]CAB0529479.1 hypothetical protein CIP100275_02248 [Corynebacterium diphtheriae]CAB0827110.1 hypothetical protein FRC0265_02115 [Corynebacterium diphtheriae]
MQPNGNVIGDTIYRTTEHGDSHRHRSRARRVHQRIPHMPAAKKTMSTLIDTLVGMKDAQDR